MSVRRCTPRVARKAFRCENCGYWVTRGAKYIEHVASPGWEGMSEHWMRLRTHGVNTTDCITSEPTR